MKIDSFYNFNYKLSFQIMEMTDVSPEEKAVIDELKRRMIDCVIPKMLEDNSLFYRFSKARNFNLSEAEAMLRNHISWRKEFGVDTILTDYDPPEVFVKYVSNCLLGFDKEGCAVVYTDIGQLDLKGLLNCATNQEILTYYVYSIEQQLKELQNKKNGKQMWLQIMDFENLPYAVATNMKVLHHGLYYLKAYVDNYPERLKIAILINAPFYFHWSFAILKQVLPAKVVQKVQIYGTDGWKEKLLELIDADELPAFLGGNKRDPDGNSQCRTFVKRGEPIPKSYYARNQWNRMGDAFKKMTVLPFSKEEISFDIKETNSNLEWEYKIKSGDIDFSLCFKGETSDTVELIPKQRTSPSDESEKGFFKCEKIGTYTLVLDNSYSWIYPKEVYYKVEIKSPNYDKSGDLL